MRAKISLTTKILTLLLVPITFEIGLVALLVHLQSEADAEAARALRAHEISDRLNMLTFDIFTLFKNAGETRHQRVAALRGEETVAQGLVLRTEAIFAGYRERLGKLKEHYAALNQLIGSDSALRSEVDKSFNSVAAAEAILNDIEDDVRNGRYAKVAANLSNDSDRMIGLLTGVVSKEFLLVAKHQREVAGQSSMRQAELRQRIVQLTIIFLVLNVLFSLALAALLVRGISTRLSRLNENAVLIGEHRPLLPRQSGTDEIAHLDSVLHDMAAQIEKDAQMRQEVVNMLTHDMRTPLMAIQGSLELFESGLGGTFEERPQQWLKIIGRNAARMKTLIADLLDSQKIQAGMITIDPTELQVSELFDEVRSSLADWLKEEGIEINCSDRSATIRGDKEKLNRVMFNLVANAIKYSPDKGVITLSAKENGKEIELSVTDEGQGIAPEVLTSIFDRFQQAAPSLRSNEAGSGLGLAICKAIVELHGGRIWATSEVGNGSTFHFTVPKA